jgi:hypothetical protein
LEPRRATCRSSRISPRHFTCAFERRAASPDSISITDTSFRTGPSPDAPPAWRGLHHPACATGAVSGAGCVFETQHRVH